MLNLIGSWSLNVNIIKLTNQNQHIREMAKSLEEAESTVKHVIQKEKDQRRLGMTEFDG